jgi:hypothetical protein
MQSLNYQKRLGNTPTSQIKTSPWRSRTLCSVVQEEAGAVREGSWITVTGKGHFAGILWWLKAWRIKRTQATHVGTYIALDQTIRESSTSQTFMKTDYVLGHELSLNTSKKKFPVGHMLLPDHSYVTN